MNVFENSCVAVHMYAISSVQRDKIPSVCARMLKLETEIETDIELSLSPSAAAVADKIEQLTIHILFRFRHCRRCCLLLLLNQNCCVCVRHVLFSFVLVFHR